MNEYNILFVIFWRLSWSENKMSSRIKEETGEDFESLKEPSKIMEQSDKAASFQKNKWPNQKMGQRTK